MISCVIAVYPTHAAGPVCPDPESSGPDVVVGGVGSVENFGAVGDVAGYSVRTDACNVGSQPVNWIAMTNQHPLIAQNMYRLKDGRFEQIGMSWVKHSFQASTGTTCSGMPGCCVIGDPAHLGVGCSDAYGAILNGTQGGLGPRYQVNPTTGEFPYPFETRFQEGIATYKRMQIRNDDLDPALNAGAMYFVEAHYISPDDALAGNANNNASYSEQVVGIPDPMGGFVISTATGTETVRGDPAILAWQADDPLVDVALVDVPGDGRFILAAKVTDLGGGLYHYEYAVHNLNSDRAAGSFSIPMRNAITISNIEFHDIDSHSGDGQSPLGSYYDTTDWLDVRNPCAVTWSTDSFAVNERANALRWGTLYNFRLDADVMPVMGEVTLGLFKPGAPGEPTSITVPLPAPSTPVPVPGMIESSMPPDGAVDARQPSEPSGTNPTGLTQVAVTFSGCTSSTMATVLAVSESGPAIDLDIDGVDPLDGQTVIVRLNRSVIAGERVTIAHTPSISQTQVGFLPGDVDGSGTSDAADILALLDTLSGVGGSLPLYAADLDRSGAVGPADLLRLIDLLVGAGSYDEYFGLSLP